jgi:glycosyltransferase involved in cell wall biosynthesis
MSAAIPMSVVVPAYNEAHVVGRCLAAMTHGACAGELEVIVVCNGCTDRTASVAQEACPDAEVVELAHRSKTDALNVGDEIATRFPRFYVDADIEVSIDALRATAAVLMDDRVLCAAPRARFELRERSWAIRKFYETWEQMPYLNNEMVGTGVYALSARGRARFGRFPALTADDQFVLQQFTADERRSVSEVSFVVFPPSTLRDLVKVRRRAYRGARELARSSSPGTNEPGRRAEAAFALARDPARVPGLIVYFIVMLAAKALALRDVGGAWERDDSSRAGT